MGLFLILTFFFACTYPVGVNLLLRFGAVQKAFEATDSVKVDFRRAWTFWPGRVHVEDLEVVMQDRNVQFVLRIPSAVVDIDLLALKDRTFHATHVRASGISFRFRHRIESDSVGTPFVAAYPPVPGFDDPPLREFGPPTAPLTEENYNLWTVHIDDVDARVRELWAQMFRYEGDAHVKGAFRLRPAKRLWVGPAELELLGGRLTAGPHDVLRDVEGTLLCKVDDFDTESVHGMEPFRSISTHLSLSAQVSNLDVVDFLSAPSPSWKLDDGSGALDVNVALDHGVFTPDSRLSYRTDHVGLGGIPFPFRLDGELALRATGPADRRGGRLTLEILHALLHLDAAKYSAPRLAGVVASLAATSADVTEDWTIIPGNLHFDEITLADLRWVNDLPLGHRTWKIDGGRGHVRGVVALASPATAEGSFAGRVEEGVVHTEKFKVRTTTDFSATARANTQRSGSAKGRFVASHLELVTDNGGRARAEQAIVDADIALTSAGAISGELRAETGAWLGDLGGTHLTGSSLSGNARLTPESVVAAARLQSVRASTLGACPFTEIDSATLTAELATPANGPSSGAIRAELGEASLQWGTFNALAARTTLRGNLSSSRLTARLDAGDIRMKSAGGAPRGWQADARSASIAADLAIADGKLEGPAQLAIEQMKGQVGKTRLQGDIVGDLDLTSDDSSLRTADISGTIQTRNVSVFTKQREVNDWWAELKLEKAHLDTRRDFDISGKVKARLRDALPALYALASEEEIPAWVPGVLPLEGLTFDLGVERYCRWTDVQVHDARGGPLAAQGRLQIEPGETRGSILLRLAAFKTISLGLNFVEDYSDASPLVGGGWLERHLAPLTSAATEKHDARCVPEPPACR